MNDTPKTDAALEWVRLVGTDSGPPHEQYVSADFARELERENAALREQLQKMQELERENAALRERLRDGWFGRWRVPSEAPPATLLLIAWGSVVSGPMGYDIGELRLGKWISDAGQQIETRGYAVCAWLPLPPLPNP